jgi:hypothetical protein
VSLFLENKGSSIQLLSRVSCHGREGDRQEAKISSF